MKKLWVLFKTNNATRVSTDGCDIVDDFLRACKKELSPRFDSVPIDLLSLSTTADGSSLRTGLELSEISGHSVNEDLHPLFIRAVDASPKGLAGPLTTSRSSSESNLKAPHRKRRKRWEKLNEILERNTNKSRKTDSIANSCVTWDDVGHVLQTTPYTQSSKAIPDIEFGILSQHLSFATKSFGPVSVASDSQRLHLIATIIICVCSLFNGDVTVDMEEDMSGVFLRTHGRFEFVLSRGRKRVCIVEAKKSNMRQGLVQTLLGCEVAAEIGHLDSVYGILTDYNKWVFLRSLDEKIEMEECCMDINTTGPVEASLLKIAGKIYAMLSDDV